MLPTRRPLKRNLLAATRRTNQPSSSPMRRRQTPRWPIPPSSLSTLLQQMLRQPPLRQSTHERLACSRVPRQKRRLGNSFFDWNLEEATRDNRSLDIPIRLSLARSPGRCCACLARPLHVQVGDTENALKLECACTRRTRDPPGIHPRRRQPCTRSPPRRTACRT